MQRRYPSFLTRRTKCLGLTTPSASSTTAYTSNTTAYNAYRVIVPIVQPTQRRGTPEQIDSFRESLMDEGRFDTLTKKWLIPTIPSHSGSACLP